MEQARISKGGQISIPARIRRRWGTSALLLEDRGDEVVLRPLPDDPVGAALGSLSTGGRTANEVRRMVRREDAEIEARRWRRS